MIMDLSIFINNLQQQNHETIVDIDANKSNDKSKNRVANLLLLNQLIDVISQKYGIYKEPNTCMRGRQRIDFLFFF